MRIVIGEDSVLLREGLKALLEEAGHHVIGTASTAEELVQLVRAVTPDIAIIDVRMPPDFSDEGLRAAITIRDRSPDVALLVLSQYVEERYAIDLLGDDNRAVGYLLKDRVADVDEFLAKLEDVAGGGIVLDAEVVAQLLNRRRRSSKLDLLTPRELEVLGLMAGGQSNSSIAAELVITLGAVEKHISNLFTKLDLLPAADQNRRVLAVLAYLGGHSV